MGPRWNLAGAERGHWAIPQNSCEREAVSGIYNLESGTHNTALASERSQQSTHCTNCIAAIPFEVGKGRSSTSNGPPTKPLEGLEPGVWKESKWAEAGSSFGPVAGQGDGMPGKKSWSLGERKQVQCGPSTVNTWLYKADCL